MALLFSVCVTAAATAGEPSKPRKLDGPQIPDLTNGGKYDSAQQSWNLGTTGAHGWIWSIPHKSTEGAKQIYVTEIEQGSPAEGVLKVGDVIVGANGNPFARDARKEFANALTLAEAPEKKGQLILSVWNDGKTREATLQLKVMGSYSNTAPLDCAKTQRIIEEAVTYLKTNGIGTGIQAKVNALGLMATGREDVMPLVLELVRNAAAAGKDLEFKQDKEAWGWGYSNLLLTEYFLATKDDTVLPAIQEYSTKIAMGQSRMGNWGHSMCVPYAFSDGPLYGISPGYGSLNQAGLPCMISMALATKCGITNEHMALAIKRGSEFFRFYVDKGAVPYGDHSPYIDCHDDNGKSSLAAVMFDLLGDQEAATFFTKMAIASHNERESGHTGNYFSFLWGPLAAARGGDAAASAFMQKLEWFFDLERHPQGNFAYQGKPGMENKRSGENMYKGWDCTGARLLAYCLPLKKLYITGKDRTVEDITGKELAEVVDAGELLARQYESLSTPELLTRLGSWSPAVRRRAAMALETKPDNVVSQLLAMLGSDNRDARYGACEGLRYAGRGSVEAADAIIAKGLGSTDDTMRFFAIRAFDSYNKEMGLSAVGNRALPVMLKMANAEGADRLPMRLKNELASALFYSGNAQKVKAVARNGEGIPQSDSDTVVRTVRELLKVDFGSSRGCVTAVYSQLTDEQLKLLWKDIYQAIRELAPGDIMFASGAREKGIELMAKHHTREGLETAAWYLTNQKPHGSRDSTKEVLKIMVDHYGGYAKAVIPQLEKAAERYENGADKPVPLPPNKPLAELIRGGIKEIEAAKTPSWKMTSIAEYLK